MIGQVVKISIFLVFALSNLILNVNGQGQVCVWSADNCTSDLICFKGSCQCPKERPRWDPISYKCLTRFPACTWYEDTCLADTICVKETCRCPPEKPFWDDRIYRCGDQEFLMNEFSTNSTANWGSWGRREMCDDGSFVVGFRVKYEFTPINGDKTAINGIEFICSKLIAPVPKRIKSLIGPFGSWVNDVFCPNNEKVVGVQYRIHPQIIGIGDDTATNAIRLVCEGGSVLTTVEGNLGNWESGTCTKNYFLCSIQTQVQSDQGYSYDDTGLNNFKFSCCRLY